MKVVFFNPILAIFAVESVEQEPLQEEGESIRTRDRLGRQRRQEILKRFKSVDCGYSAGYALLYSCFKNPCHYTKYICFCFHMVTEFWQLYQDLNKCRQDENVA